ncbi:MAG: formylglycine-generating enzyme family protein [Scytonema sp. PMC 1069.18]|nr:formylglycine-generating enzyme family protein [Scytonema sp. PMC 1069.18]MEC4881736.1 formylglycine-generating enzyme family protein [Scytonema sp. PMC 1070.18]
MNKVRPEIATRRIESFRKRFGKQHLDLAYHAAFPLSLTPDLLYRLWMNFQRDIHGEVLGIPWVAVADLLLSSLCDEVGHELYEMSLSVRNELLKRLKEDKRFGEKRLHELSDFLLEYTRQFIHSDDPDIRDFAQGQQWIALSYTQPSEAARQLASTLSKTYHQDRPDLIRLTSLVETLTEPLGEFAEFQPLLIYARGMRYFAGDNLEAATSEIRKALGGKNEIEVAGVKLPIPKEIKPTNRRKVLQYLGWGSVGMGLTIVGGTLLQNRSNQTPLPNPSPSPNPQTSEVVTLQIVEFPVITVNARGEIISRDAGQARFFQENLGNGITIDMVEIPSGQFLMGSPPGEEGRYDSESPQHTVTIQTFFMGRFAVTQEQYQAVMGNNPSYFKGEKRPVENVSWNDAVKFCDTLNKRTGKSYRYRLPSEAEWECACRAGTTTPFHYGETVITGLVNYYGDYTYASAPKGEYRQQTLDVGTFPPNAFGLYEMHGNVWEWCLDTWHENYNGAPTSGRVWESDNNQFRILRGGSWVTHPKDCRSAYRGYYDRNTRDYRYDNISFRMVVPVPKLL